MAPSPTGTASCMYCPRRLTVRRASAKDSVPAATCAAYSPRLWPAANDGAQTSRLDQAAGSHAHRKNRRLRVLRELQAVGWPLEAQPAQRLAKRRIRLRKRLAADVEPRGKALPHPDLLRTLTRKDERNHDGRDPDGAPCDDFARQAIDEMLIREARGHVDRVAHRLGRRPAVTDDAEAVQTEQRRTAELGIVDASPEASKRLAREEVADSRPERRRQLLVQQSFDRLDEALADLQRDVPGEPVADDHVGVARVHVTTLDVADETHRRGLQQLMRLAGQGRCPCSLPRPPTAARRAAIRTRARAAHTPTQ